MEAKRDFRNKAPIAGLCFLLAAMVMLAGAGTPEAADTWVSRISNFRIDYRERSVVTTSDGGYILSGTYYDDDGIETYTGLAKFDALGNLQWAKSYDHNLAGSYGSARAIDNTDDGGFVFIWEESGLAPPGVYIARLDSAGNLIQSACVYSSINHAEVIGNHCYLLMSQCPLNEGLGIIKLNLDTFAVEWRKEVAFAYSGLYLRSVKAGQNDNLVIIGEVSYQPEIGWDNYILKLTDQGIVQAFQILGNPQVDLKNRMRDVAVMNDGSLVLGGEFENITTGDSYKVWAVKISTNWSIAWQKVFEGIETDWCSSVSVLNDGSILLGAGTRSWSPNRQYDTWGICLKDKVNSPKVKWQKRFWTVDRDENLGQVATPDGGILLVGDHRFIPGIATRSTILFKADAKGDFSATDASGAIIPCPCLADTDAEIWNSNDTISDGIAHVSVGDWAIEIIPDEPITPGDLMLSFEKLCN